MMPRRPAGLRSAPSADDGPVTPAESDGAPEPRHTGPVGLRARGRPAPLGQRGRAIPRGLTGARDPHAESGLSGVVLFLVTNMAYFLCAAVIPVHLLFAVEEHSFAVRILTALPAVILILETQHFLKHEAGELPFMPLALLQYYVVFCLGLFFDLPFYDLQGPVNFSPDARLGGATAVALGAMCLWLGARLGRKLGPRAGALLEQAMPRRELPEQWDRAFYIYGAATMAFSVMMLFWPNALPAPLVQPIYYAFPMELLVGFAIIAPPRRLGPRTAHLLIGFTILVGILRGTLEAVFRAGIAFTTGTWAAFRKVSLRLALAVLVIYALFQPVKTSFRDQVWGASARSSQTIGVGERVTAWQNAFSTESRHDQQSSGSIARLSELGAVMHMFDVCPGRVDYLNGSGFLPILYAPIPRFIWPNKPTTRETFQRYAVVFGRQTELGAITTAINLPLLTEGYWNFGWPGIVFVCVALGLWLGMSQKAFASDHWAMRATGIANITAVTVAGPIITVYSSIFQLMTGRLVVCWGIFWLGTLLSRRRYDSPAIMGRQALLRRGAVRR
ncbi:Hypothetical protein A7982_07504 [Minicystis rosea]|nr:Hypothetical protein A7982_07504 [Minicystis rosea]